VIMLTTLLFGAFVYLVSTAIGKILYVGVNEVPVEPITVV